MQENYMLLESRLNAIKSSKDNLEASISVKTEENNSLIMEISNLKPDMKALDRKQEQLMK